MKKHQIKLIDNVYPVEDARDVLLSLINDKIRFLNVKLLARQEFGADSSVLESRIAQLKQEQKELLNTLKACPEGSCTIEINCDIRLKINELTV